MHVVEDDIELAVQGARAGDTRAWDRLFKRFQLPLYTYLHELTHDEQSSLDLVQDSFISAIRHLPSLRADAKFGSWLFGIAHQKWIQRWRRMGGGQRSWTGCEELDPLPD